ncbi:MAG: MgtC/SapB family protein [Erysipelotrichia bacterium]|nr:MgtC/SapB family protein [Erysipelotrichia bacterium]NCC54249.1 MgtC/SapB family protein [Erysipelotrichia bacterium]
MEFTQELLLRIFLSAICGAAIGYERKNRHKEAGIRTHILVAIGAALMMIVSKYGFDDILGLKGIALDPSRIAAQIVTGVGFLGAGIIFVRNHMVNGLTTAAGIWVTSGIGMAIGSGLYVIGIVSALGVVLIQIILHLPLSFLHSLDLMKVEIHVNEQEIMSKIKMSATLNHIHLFNVEMLRQGECWQIIIKAGYEQVDEKEQWLAELQGFNGVTYLHY